MNLLNWPIRNPRAIGAQFARNPGTPPLHTYARTSGRPRQTSGRPDTQRDGVSGKDAHSTGHGYGAPETWYAVPPSIDAHLTPNCGQLMATEATS